MFPLFCGFEGLLVFGFMVWVFVGYVGCYSMVCLLGLLCLILLVCLIVWFASRWYSVFGFTLLFDFNCFSVTYVYCFVWVSGCFPLFGFVTCG